MDVIANGFEIPVATAVDEQGLVAPTKEVPEELMSPVEPGSLGA